MGKRAIHVVVPLTGWVLYPQHGSDVAGRKELQWHQHKAMKIPNVSNLAILTGRDTSLVKSDSSPLEFRTPLLNTKPHCPQD